MKQAIDRLLKWLSTKKFSIFLCWLVFLISSFGLCYSAFACGSNLYDALPDTLVSACSQVSSSSQNALFLSLEDYSFQPTELGDTLSAFQKAYPSSTTNNLVYGRSYTDLVATNNELPSFSYDGQTINCHLLSAPFMDKYVSYLGCYLISGNYSSMEDKGIFYIYLSQRIARSLLASGADFSSLTGKTITSNNYGEQKFAIGGVFGNGSNLDRTPFYDSVFEGDYAFVCDRVNSIYPCCNLIFEMSLSSGIGAVKLEKSNRAFATDISKLARSKSDSRFSLAKESSLNLLLEKQINDSKDYYHSVYSFLYALLFVVLALLNWFLLFLSSTFALSYFPKIASKRSLAIKSLIMAVLLGTPLLFSRFIPPYSLSLSFSIRWANSTALLIYVVFLLGLVLTVYFFNKKTFSALPVSNFSRIKTVPTIKKDELWI